MTLGQETQCAYSAMLLSLCGAIRTSTNIVSTDYKDG